MKITIFLNKKYLTSTYLISDELLDRFTTEVLPKLLNRLSMDSRVISIDIFTNDSLEKNLGFSSKVHLNSFDSSGISTYGELISVCIGNKKEEDIMIVINPMFPFLSLEKINLAYQKVLNNQCNSAIGIDKYYATKINSQNIEAFDAGIFSIFKISDFKKSNHRLHPPVFGIELSALELISLRGKEDYELYGLVVNSGLM
jgi:hypothetical protein